jgi:DNA-binding SARP family transcriptional activator
VRVHSDNDLDQCFLPRAEGAMPRLRVQVLGGFTVYRTGAGFVPIASSCRPVLGYVLTHRNRHRRFSRVELAETLWADHDGTRARRCLSTALWRLKKSTGSGPSLLVYEGADEVSFNWEAPAWVDSVAMELRVQSLLRVKPEMLTHDDIARLARGVRLYRGDYMTGIDDEWACTERYRLRNLYLEGLYHLMLAYAAVFDWFCVLKWGRRLNREEPLREDVHRLLMRAYAHTGNRAKAIAQYRECRCVLHDDLGIEPMAETQELFRQLARLAPPRDPPPAAPALKHAHRCIVRVRRVLASYQQQLDKALDSLAQAGRQKGHRLN